MAEGRYQDALEEVRNRQAVLAQRRSELAIARQQLADSGARCARSTAPSASAWPSPASTWPPARRWRRWCASIRCGCGSAVPEREAGGVRVGQPVRADGRGRSDRAYAGAVARLSPAISEDNRTLIVEAEVPNADGALRPGSFARAEIVVQPATRPIARPRLRRSSPSPASRRCSASTDGKARREARPHRPPLRRPGRDPRRASRPASGHRRARQPRPGEPGACRSVGSA